MSEGLAVFVKATFFKDVLGETDAERQAFCEGSPGSCLSNVLGVFRFTDPEGIMTKHVASRDNLVVERDALSNRIKLSRSPRPILLLLHWWKAKELESIREKEMLLVRRQMWSSDLLFEEVKHTLRPYTYSEALGARLDELLDATGVKIEMRRGRLTELALDYVA